MKIIHQDGYTEAECISYRGVVFNNAIQSLMAILRAMGQLKIDLHAKQRTEDMRVFFHITSQLEDGEMTPEVRVEKNKQIAVSLSRTDEKNSVWHVYLR